MSPLEDLDDNLNPKIKERNRINPERDFFDKSIPYSKLRLKGNLKGGDFDEESPIEWSNINFNGGWIALDATWTFLSSDNPTYVVTTSSSMEGSLSVGMKIRLVNASVVKYFFVTGISSLTVTLYGGTDYTITNSPISSIFYSSWKAPLGFSLDPRTWTFETTSPSALSQASPTAAIWYNLGGYAISVPIGAWRGMFDVVLSCLRNGATAVDVHVALSTSSSNPNDPLMRGFQEVDGAGGDLALYTTIKKEGYFILTSKTTYYLIAMTDFPSILTMQFRGDLATTITRFVCAYL